VYFLHNRRSESCLNIARDSPEPDSTLYHPRAGVVSEWPSGAPKAYYSWEGNITLEMFHRVPMWFRWNLAWSHVCPHCGWTNKYKLLNRQLYIHNTHQVQTNETRAFQELVIVAAYLFDIPDVDFVVHFGDGQVPGLPALYWTVNRTQPQGGFTMPSAACWHLSLGKAQMKIHAKCLQARYPQDNRIPKLVWRGTTSDAELTGPTAANAMWWHRIQLHLMGKWHPNLLDVSLVNISQSDTNTTLLKEMVLGMGPRMPIEDFNNYVGVIDVDGYGWSDRFAQLVFSNTPIVKQVGNHSSMDQPCLT
jgi:hypothetical protein